MRLPTMTFRRPLSSVLLCSLALASGATQAQVPTAPPVGRSSSAPIASQAPSVTPPSAERSLDDWLMRWSEASRRRAYQGTFVVSAGGGAWSSARIWHVCDGDQQLERVESLNGAQRFTYRHNDQVVTFWPESKLARTEKRDSVSLFPGMLSSLLKSGDNSIPEFYSVRMVGRERIAGFEADVVQLRPRDALRYGYRVWSEQKTGLAIKLQTLDAEGRVLEQSAFSELQIDAPVKLSQLAQQMNHTEGYRVEKTEMIKTTAAAEGWALKVPVPGFKPLSCLKRQTSATPSGGDSTLQWIFSDGLASVSLFIETFDRTRHSQEGLMALGATQTLTRKWLDKNGGAWWLTVVGEVPPQTLQAFAQGLERRP